MRDVRWADFDGRDVVTWLQDRSESDRPAITWVPFDGPARTWTYRDLVSDVLSTAGGLQSAGMGRGTIIGLLMDNCPQMVIGWFAAVAAGASALCINARAGAEEISWIAEHSGAGLFLVDTEHRGLAQRSLPDSSRIIDATSALPLGETWTAPDLDPRALASVQYTSGTTSRPKGVRWTHANCLWAAHVNATHQELNDSDVYLVTLPLFHTNALAYQLLPALQVGAHVILQPRFSSSRFWDVSTTYACTWTGVVHFIVRALRDIPAPPDHDYRGWAGSTVQHADTTPAGVSITGWFGMTETISHPICAPPSQVDALPPDSIGRPSPEYRVRIDSDTSDSGELSVQGVRGISLFDGYLNDEEATSQVLTDDGWFRTGDRIRADEAGNYFFVERIGDVLKVGGENVGAGEIERVLAAVPGVREVAVVARPDPMLGQVPVAFVIGDDPTQLEPALRNAAQVGLAEFKRPSEYRFVADFPRATLNKVAKARLRRELQEEDR